MAKREFVVQPNAERIEQLQKEKYIDDAKLAAKAAIDPRTLAKIKRGETCLKSKLFGVAKALEVDYDEICVEFATPPGYVDGQFVTDGDLSQPDLDPIIAIVDGLRKSTKDKRPIYIICLGPANSILVQVKMHIRDAIEIAADGPYATRRPPQIHRDSFAYMGLSPDESRYCAVYLDHIEHCLSELTDGINSNPLSDLSSITRHLANFYSHFKHKRSLLDITRPMPTVTRKQPGLLRSIKKLLFGGN
jgi:hypothetical protein